MSESKSCKMFQELLPLLFNGQLEELSKEEIRKHLSSCDECRLLFRKEAPLMQLAGSDEAARAFEEHPDSRALDDYVFNPSILSAKELESINGHLNRCEECGEIVKGWRLLPSDPDRLTAGEDLGMIDEVSKMAADKGRAGKKRETDQVHVYRWLAAAAALVIVAATTLTVIRTGDDVRQADSVVQFLKQGEGVLLKPLQRSDVLSPEILPVDGAVTLDIRFEAFPGEESYRMTIEDGHGQVAEGTIEAGDFYQRGRIMVRLDTSELTAGEYRLKIHAYSRSTAEPLAIMTYPFRLSK